MPIINMNKWKKVFLKCKFISPLLSFSPPIRLSVNITRRAHLPASPSSASRHLMRSPPWPTHWLFVSFYSSGTKRTTIIIIHHTTVRVEPDPMTAIQGGEQRPSVSPPTPIIDSSATTQAPLMGGPLSPVTLPAARRPLLVPHKATGGAMTQTRTSNVLPVHPPTPNSKRQNADGVLYRRSTGSEGLNTLDNQRHCDLASCSNFFFCFVFGRDHVFCDTWGGYTKIYQIVMS